MLQEEEDFTSPNKIKEPAPRSDPHTLIRQRLGEILAVSPEEVPADQETEVPEVREAEKAAEVEEEKIIPQDEQAAEIPEEIPVHEEIKAEFVAPSPIRESQVSDTEQIIIQEAKKAKDILDTMEIEYALEESILASIEKLPVIDSTEQETVPPEVNPAGASAELKSEEPESEIPQFQPEDLHQATSFTGWLKRLSPQPFRRYEELHNQPHSGGDAPSHSHSSTPPSMTAPSATLSEVEGLSEDHLIDQFIATAPKIVPTKATEFYSPISQARKSVTEHEDMVSETLAHIYFQQGNFAKARWCYEKLSLLFPEKSSYFAPLLEKAKEAEGGKTI
jgi:hypothetical protein